VFDFNQEHEALVSVVLVTLVVDFDFLLGAGVRVFCVRAASIGVVRFLLVLVFVCINLVWVVFYKNIFIKASHIFYKG
jgi:hypothetical protein